MGMARVSEWGERVARGAVERRAGEWAEAALLGRALSGGCEVLGRTRGSGPRERTPQAEGKSGPPVWPLGCFLGLGLIGFLFFFPFLIPTQTLEVAQQPTRRPTLSLSPRPPFPGPAPRVRPATPLPSSPTDGPIPQRPSAPRSRPAQRPVPRAWPTPTPRAPPARLPLSPLPQHRALVLSLPARARLSASRSPSAASSAQPLSR